MKAPSNNAKMLSYGTLTTQMYFLLTLKWMESFLNETMHQVDKENNNEGQLKSLKIHELLTK